MVICSYTAMACDVPLIVTMIVFFLKYHKTMQAMLAAFLQTNTKNSGIQSVQADQIGRTYLPLFTINLPKEEEILDDLKEISTMEYVVQVIMIIVCIAVVIIIIYFCCTKCRHTHTIFKYCSILADFMYSTYVISYDWMFSITDMNIETNLKGRCANRNFLLYI